MRERYLEAFDAIFIDNLHGDRLISERAPDGRSSATVFAIRGQSPGIKVGTSIATFVRKAVHVEQQEIFYRDFDAANADDRRASLITSLDGEKLHDGYHELRPALKLGLPFKKGAARAGYLVWPKIVDLLPSYFPGVQTKRDSFLVDIDRSALEERINDYFDESLSYEEFSHKHPDAVIATARYEPSGSNLTLGALV